MENTTSQSLLNVVILASGGGGVGGGASIAFTITTSSLPDGILGKPYSATIKTSGGTSPYIWSAVGLPDGLKIDASSGIISGTPAKEGKYTISISVQDNSGQKINKDLILTITHEENTLPPSMQIFNDILGHWAENNIEKLVAMGDIKGYPGGTFQPDRPITRAEFTTVLVKAFNLEPRQGKVFNDTVKHWAKDTISTAAAYEIVKGYNKNTFGPDDLITREQMATMIVKAAKLSIISGQASFADSANISTWARDAVSTAVKNKIITGYPDNTFRPQNNATRAEAVTIIINAIK
ncbi:MAG: S-layer homology domain-containing protein [Bacillota bacterium]